MVQYIRLALSKGPKRVGVSLPSPEDGNIYSFGNVVFSSDFEFRTVDEVHKPRNSECYVPSSEPIRFYLYLRS
jgi:hypothetical protein